MFNLFKRRDPWTDLVTEVTVFTSHAIKRPLNIQEAGKIAESPSIGVARQALDVFWLVPHAYRTISMWNGCANTCHSFGGYACSIGLFALAPLGMIITGHEILDKSLQKAITTDLKRKGIHPVAIQDEYEIARYRIIHMACHAGTMVLNTLIALYKRDGPNPNERDIIESFLNIAKKQCYHPKEFVTREVGYLESSAEKLLHKYRSWPYYV